MDRIELVGMVRELTIRVEQMQVAKTSSLEQEQTAKSESYSWCREQMIAIHQLKYQFSKEVALLHRETVHLNQELRCKINQLRGGPCVSPVVESLDADNTQLPSAAPSAPEDLGL